MNSMRAYPAIVVSLLALVGTGSVGCAGREARRAAARTARHERQLLAHASRDTGCPGQQLVAQQISAEPPVFSVTGCATPIEYWMRCGGRRQQYCQWRHVARVNEAAAEPLACPPDAILQRATQTSNERVASGCGRAASFRMICNDAACGWALTGSVRGAQPPAEPEQSAAQSPAQETPTVEPTGAAPAPATSGPGLALSDRVSRQREAILSCVDGPSVTLHLRWTADGRVLTQLPSQLSGTPSEGCVHEAVGTMRVQAGEAGEIVIPVH